MIQVVHKRPSMPAEVVTVENTLEALRALLDGGYLCGISVTPTIHGYVDDEGLLKKLPLNFMLNGERIVGPAIFSKADGNGNDIGFTGNEALEFCKFMNVFEEPSTDDHSR